MDHHDATTPGADTVGGLVTLDTIDFNHNAASGDVADVEVHSSHSLMVRGCRRRYTANTDSINHSPHFGITLRDENGSPVVDWNRFSALLSNQGSYDRGIVRARLDVDKLANGSTVVSATANQSALPWQRPTDTYTYRVDVLYDSSRLLGCAGTNSVPVAATNGGNGVLLGIDATRCLPGYTIRVYRWKGAATYPEDSVDIPLAGAVQFLRDNGNHLSGFGWNACNNAAGTSLTLARDQLANYAPRAGHVSGGNLFFGLVLATHGGNRRVPSGGRWAQGDLILNESMTGGTVYGYACSFPGKGHGAGTGDTTNGGFSVANVSNIGSWQVGDTIRGAGIPTSTTCTAVNPSTNTITLSQNATATATGVAIYDAEFREIGSLPS